MTSALEDAKEDKAVEWLLGSKNPAIRYWTFKDILGQPEMEYVASQPIVRLIEPRLIGASCA